MGEAQVVLVGATLGVVSNLFSMYLFELALKNRRQVSVAIGLASITVSFVLLASLLLAVYTYAQRHVLLFGTAEAVSFLLLWAVEAWRAWRSANRTQGPGERKRGEPTR